MQIHSEIKLDFKDVLLRPKRSELPSRRAVDLKRHMVFKHSGRSYCGVPIMASNMDGVGTQAMAQALSPLGLFTCVSKHCPATDISAFLTQASTALRSLVAITLGLSADDRAKWDALCQICKDEGVPIQQRAPFVCLDVANGYSEHFVDYVKEFRGRHPEMTIIAGNVVTAEMTEQLILSGADIVKVGIGSGSVCTTRIKTGVGYPQLSAIIECKDAAHGLKGHIVADGGCGTPGDIAKAFAAGADFVMLGGMLSGHDEGGGRVVVRHLHDGEYKDNGQPAIIERRFIEFYGMASHAGQLRNYGKLQDYRASEGRLVLVPYRGGVADTVADILGGLRSACSYVGANRLKDLSKCATFVQVNAQYNGMFEKMTIGD